MPRDRRAVIGTAIWNEPSIRALPYAQQHAYMLAYTQADLSRCGVLAYRPKRWAGFASDLSVRHLRKQFDALHQSRHVVLDDDHEELLIRTYVGHDGLLAQPLVVAAMVRDFAEVNSPIVRLAVLTELRRLWDKCSVEGERKGLLLLLGADPAALNLGNGKPEQVNRIRAAIGEGLIHQTTQAVAEGQIDPYPKGPLEGLAEGLPDPLTCGRSRMSPAPTPAPTPTPSSDSDSDLPSVSHLTQRYSARGVE